MWPFSKAQTIELHPQLKRFREIMNNPRCLECFENVMHGMTQLPLDVASSVQEAINITNSITSLTPIHPSALVQAVKSGNFAAINERLQQSEKNAEKNALDNSRPLKRIIEWANDHKLPEFRPYDAFTYKEIGVPRNIRQLYNMRWLLVNEDHGLTEIPGELHLLPQLQGICLCNNQIHSIPADLYKCPALRRLDLENNEIKRVNKGIHELRNLHALDLCENKLEYVTPDIAKMPSLRTLDIRNQKTTIDFMRDADTPLSEQSLDALYTLVNSIDVKY